MKTLDKFTELDADTVQRLAQQLALWAQEFITGGRSPFRRVETFEPLLTESGEVAPPLVFWINRDSFMAGGAVFFPERGAPSPLPEGRLSADALGLNYYVTWDIDAISLWQRQGDSWAAVKTLPVGRSRKPGPTDFHDALLRLMEEMKTFSVLGAIAPDRLSPYYLANLLYSTLRSLWPPLTEHYRIHRALGHNHQGGISAERQALGKALLTLSRIMALALHDTLPGTVQPQTLEAAMGKFLADLPAPLSQALQIMPHEAPLPEETLVRLHLLLHRLTQLGIARKTESAVLALDILRQHTAAELDGYPLPATVPAGSDGVLLIHPEEIPENLNPEIVVGGPSLMALQTLLRTAYRLPPPTHCTCDPMAIPADPAPKHICGTLVESSLPAISERQALTARLRLSWPTRRFRLPSRTPLWAWQMLHLLGLGAEGARFDLVTPPRWPTSVYGRQLLALLLETASLETFQEVAHGLYLRFSKHPQPDVSIRVEHALEPRYLTQTQLLAGHVSLLPLALSVPKAIWEMIEDGRLTIPPVQNRPRILERGAFLFTRSSLGRYLWHIAGGGRPLPRRAALQAEIMRQGLPLPGEKALSSLQRLQPDTDVDPPTALLDQELALWLGPYPELPAPVRSSPSDETARPEQDLTEQELIASLEGRVFMDGIPLFPEHYLYDYYRPEMRTYSIDGPLGTSGEFFGTIELRDDRGQTLQVEGQETAQALELISSLRTGAVDLPVDRDITAAILDRYRADLRKLRGSLVKEVFRREADPQTAKSLVEKLWRQHPLPPWRLIAGT